MILSLNRDAIGFIPQFQPTEPVELSFNLAHYDVSVKHFSYYTSGGISIQFSFFVPWTDNRYANSLIILTFPGGALDVNVGIPLYTNAFKKGMSHLFSLSAISD